MRTTVRIDDQLLQQAKLYALETGCTLTKLLEQSLRETLARSKKYVPGKPVCLITVGGDGVLPGVDLDDSASLLEIMDGSNDSERY